MTNQAQPGRPPAHDLSAFDLSKRSPEQLAQSFARWKAQRKRQPEEARGAQPLQPQPNATTVADSAPEEAPKASKRTKSLEYSATFSALLEAGSEPAVQRPDPAPITPRPAPKPDASSGRRLKAMSILAGVASLVALAAGALLELSHRPDPNDAKPVAAHPHQAPAAPIAAAATKAPTAPWRLQRTVDLALMKAALAADVARPMPPTAEPPVVQTASKAVRSEPASRKEAPETAPFVAKPFIPSGATAAQEPAVIPPTPVAVRSSDPRPDALFQRRDRSTTASNRVASGSKPAEATGARSSGEVPSARTATARGKVASSGSSDPRGEGGGGARVGSAVNGKTGGDNVDAGGGEAAAPNGGSASGTAGSDDAGSGGSDTGGSGTSGNGSSGSAAGSGDTGGDAAGGSSAGSAGDGDAESGDGEDSESGGIGGAIDGAVGAVGDALGGGKGNPDSNDKDQRN